MYANKLCILTYNHTLCLKTLFWYKHKKTTLFCSDFVWRKFTGLKYFIAAKPNSKCYVNSMYFYSYAKGSAKRYLLNFVTFYNRCTGQQRKKLQKATQNCAVQLLHQEQAALVLTNEAWPQAAWGQEILTKCFLKWLFLLFFCVLPVKMWQSIWGQVASYQWGWSKAPFSEPLLTWTQPWLSQGKLTDYT